MKKYLSLFVILLIVFTINTNVLKANDDDSSSDKDKKVELADDGIENDSKDENDDSLNQETKTKIEALKKQIKTVREEAKVKMEALRENVKNEKDAVKAKIKEQRIEGREKALERFDSAIERVNDLKEKINIQIAKLETRGIILTDVKTLVTTAETKLTEAKNKIAEINALLASSINELTKENKTKITTLTKNTQSLIVEAHKALGDAVKLLKDKVRARIETEKKLKEVENDDNDNN